VISTGGNPVTLELASLAGLPPGWFNFSGTGAAAGGDAAASAYTISLPASLSSSSLSSGAPVSVTGFVAPYGSAPPDFDASALTSYGTQHVLLSVWFGSSAPIAPFAILTPSELQLSAATLAASAQDALRAGPIAINLSALSSGLNITPDANATDVQYALVHARSDRISTFNTFNDFVTALSNEFNGNNTTLAIAAEGPYTASSASLAADWMVVTMND
jgi:hypothetical protein